MIKIKFLNDNAILPKYADNGAIGMDFYSSESGIVWPFTQKMISTGIACEIPNGTYLRVAPRSGLALKKSLHVMAGVVDPSYRGEIKVIIRNFGWWPYTFNKGDRIAQGILENAIIDEIQQVNELSDTSRKENGFGSTGK